MKRLRQVWRWRLFGIPVVFAASVLGLGFATAAGTTGCFPCEPAIDCHPCQGTGLTFQQCYERGLCNRVCA